MSANQCGVYANPTPSQLGECRSSSPTLRDSLRNKRAALEAQLQEVNEAITALDANPGVERVLDLVAKTTRY